MLSSQIFLFTGENAYELDREKERWVQGFIQKHGTENLIKVDKKSFVFSEICDEISSAPFLAEKRLVILDGIPTMEKEQWQVILDCIHPATLLLIVDPKPDKRLSVTKAILASVDVKDFPPLPDNKLLSWVESEAGISRSMAQYLMSIVGTNQMLLAREIAKLQTHGGEIDKQLIDTLVLLSGEQAVWHLMDLIARGDTAKMHMFVYQVLKRGEDPHGLWGRMLWMVAQLAAVCSAVWEGQTSPQAVAKESGVNFMSAKTLIPVARALDQKQLQTVIATFARCDRELKTGVLKSTTDSTEEITVVIDTCLATLGRS